MSNMIVKRSAKEDAAGSLRSFLFGHCLRALEKEGNPSARAAVTARIKQIGMDEMISAMARWAFRPNISAHDALLNITKPVWSGRDSDASYFRLQMEEYHEALDRACGKK